MVSDDVQKYTIFVLVPRSRILPQTHYPFFPQGPWKREMFKGKGRYHLITNWTSTSTTVQHPLNSSHHPRPFLGQMQWGAGAWHQSRQETGCASLCLHQRIKTQHSSSTKGMSLPKQGKQGWGRAPYKCICIFSVLSIRKYG